MDFTEIYNIYLVLIQNPFAPKHYRDLQKYYESINATQIVEDFDYVIDVKFNRDDTNDKHSDKK